MSSEFELEAAQRVPLADVALRSLDYILNKDFLDDVFDRHRGRSYENSISFPVFVNLLADSLLGNRGSAHLTFQHARENNALKASVQAMYGKLRRVPIALSTGLFTEATARLHEIASPTVANKLPECVASLRVLGFDGKKLKYVVKRLKPLRGLKGNIYGGKMLVVQDLETQQAIAVEALPDGESSDNLLVPPVVDRVRAIADDRARLWVGDRAFCDYKLLGLLSANIDHFLVRYNTSCGFHPDETVPARTGQDDEGRPYRQEWGWLGKPNNPHRIRVRMITITSPREDPLVFVTSLMDADRYAAIDLLTLYRSRWKIETMFQQAVQTFDLRHLIGGTPQATVFQAMLCLLLYNITLVIRDHVADGANREPMTVSTKLLFDDVVRQLTGYFEVIGIDATLELLSATRILKPDDLRSHIQQKLGGVWTDRWKKSPTRKRPPKAPPRAYICGGHTSVDKILRGAHHEIPLKPGGPPPHKAKKDV
jgi:Transposase DDE domain